jgi:hypothetical protein
VTLESGGGFESLWLPDRLQHFNLTRLLVRADFVTVQSYRWDVMCMWMHTMHKRPLSDADLKDYSAHHLIPTIALDTLLVLHELRYFAPTARFAIVIAPAPFMAPGFSSHHRLMAHPSSIAAATAAASTVWDGMQDIHVIDWAMAAVELGVQCIDNDGNHIRLECSAPLLCMIRNALLD